MSGDRAVEIRETLGGELERQAARFPGKEFIVFPDRNLRFTYGAFDARVNTLARGLMAIGIGKGDHVGIWATNVPDWLTVMFAAAKIGAVTVTVNTSYRTHELEYLVRQSDMKGLCLISGFKDSDYVAMVNELIPELKQCERGKLQSARFPRLRSVIFMGPEKHRGMYTTPELLLLGAHAPDGPREAASTGLRCDEVINMQYTSGTTGFPKGADAPAQLNAFMATHGVTAVVFRRQDPAAAAWRAMLESSGARIQAIDDVVLARPDPAALERLRGASAVEMECRLDDARFAALLDATDLYLASGQPPAALSPFRAQQLGLLPPGWVRNDDAAYSSEGLWLAPWNNGRVSVGVRASYACVQRLVARYGAGAAQTYFPYPRPLESNPKGDLFQRKLVMVFTREALAHAAASARVGLPSAP